MKWYRTLGYTEDPFLTGAIAGTEDVMDDIAYFVRAGSMIFIEEPNGWMIHKLVAHFAGKKKVIFLNAEDQRVIPVEELLIGRNGIIGKVFRNLPKDMMLFVENAPTLTIRNAEKLKHYYDNDTIHSIVLSAQSYERSRLPESIRDRIGSRIFTLPTFSEQVAVESIQRMLDSLVFFPAQLIKLVHKRFPLPEDFFMICSRICEAAIREKSDKVTSIHLQVMHAE